MSKPPITTRQRNLKSLIAQWGGGEALAKKLGYSNGSYLSHMATGYRPITEKTARVVEEKLRLPAGWMDAEHEPDTTLTQPAVRVDPTLFAQVAATVAALMEEMGLKLEVGKFSDIVGYVYEDAIEAGRVNEAMARRYLQLAR